MRTQYQGRIHELQKKLMSRYYEELTRAAESHQEKAAWMLISGNPVELVRAFGFLPVFPEVNALQLGVRKQALPYILKAEERGYSIDNCAYVKADIGLYLSGLKAPFATIPEPSLILCNYVGCGVYLQWFEHLAEYTNAPIFNLDIPTVRDVSGLTRPDDLRYVVRQLEELITLCELITNRQFDEAKLRHILALSRETGELWSEIKAMTRNTPSPFDAFFDAVTLMGPLYCLRGTGGLWEFGFRHDPDRPLESIAEHMLQYNLTNRSFLQRYAQIRRYLEEWNADALIIHSVKSCRLFSAGQGDMREYFSKELGIPTLLIESDLEDPRYFSEAQMRNRIDAFFEALDHRKRTRGQGAAAC